MDRHSEAINRQQLGWKSSSVRIFRVTLWDLSDKSDLKAESMGMEYDELQTRHSLLQRLKDWDNSTSWQEFFDIYWRLIFNVAVKAGLSPEEAQDVVQETVVSVAKKIGEFQCGREAGSFRAYLRKLTHWRITDQFRKRKKLETKPHHDPEDTDKTDFFQKVPDQSMEAMEKVWDEEWKRNLFDAALEKVAPRVKPENLRLFELYVVQELPIEDVAKETGATRSQIYLAKHRVQGMVWAEMKELESRLW